MTISIYGDKPNLVGHAADDAALAHHEAEPEPHVAAH